MYYEWCMTQWLTDQDCVLRFIVRGVHMLVWAAIIRNPGLLVKENA